MKYGNMGACACLYNLVISMGNEAPFEIIKFVKYEYMKNRQCGI